MLSPAAMAGSRQRLRKEAARVNRVDRDASIGEKAGRMVDSPGKVTRRLGGIFQVGVGHNPHRKRAGKPHDILAPRHAREVASQLIEGGEGVLHAKTEVERILLGVELLQVVHHHFPSSQALHGQA